MPTTTRGYTDNLRCISTAYLRKKCKSGSKNYKLYKTTNQTGIAKRGAGFVDIKKNHAIVAWFEKG